MSIGIHNQSTPVELPQMQHPLDNLTAGGWVKAAARFALAAVLLTGVLWVTGEETWAQVWKVEHLPLFAVGVFLTILQRVLRIKKWSLILADLPLIQRPWTQLLRIQFVGMLANLLVPVSEGLKIWAVCKDKKDAGRAIESLLFDTGTLSAAVGLTGIAALVALGGGIGTVVWLVPVLTVMALCVLAIIRFRPREGQGPRFKLSVAALAVVEAMCLLGVFAAALWAMGVPVSGLFFVAVFPVLYLSHLVMLTPSGLGLREALFALVFAGLSQTPTETAVAMGLLISAMQLFAALGTGVTALLWPGARLSAGGR